MMHAIGCNNKQHIQYYQPYQYMVKFLLF